MKHVHSVTDIEGNPYCIVDITTFMQYDNSNEDFFFGFYGYIKNDKFIASSKRKHLDPQILFVEGDEKLWYQIKK